MKAAGGKRPAVAAAALALALAAGCGIEGQEIEESCHLYDSLGSLQVTFAEPLEPPMRLTIEQCRRDTETCEALCGVAMQMRDAHGEQLDCDVRVRGNIVEVSVTHVNLSGCVETNDAFTGQPGESPD